MGAHLCPAKAILCGLVFFSQAISFAEPVRPASDVISEKVTELSNFERNDGFLFHAGVLWVGHSAELKNRVEIFTGDSKTRHEIPLTHGGNSVKPFGANAVIITGAFEEKTGTIHSAFTIVELEKKGDPTSAKIVERREFSPELMVTSTSSGPIPFVVGDRGTGALVSYKPFVSIPGQKDPEYKPADEEEDTDLQTVLNVEAPGSFIINKPTLTQEEADDVKKDPNLVSGPGKMTTKSGWIYIIEERSTKLHDDGVVRMQSQVGKVERVFKKPLNGALDIFAMDERFPYVATLEAVNKKVHLINAVSGQVEKTIEVPKNPAALSQAGNCLLVLGGKEVFFYHLGQEASLIDRWDLSHYGFFLDFPRSLVVDETTKTVFVASRRNCDGCQAKSNGIVSARQASNRTFDRCFAK